MEKVERINFMKYYIEMTLLPGGDISLYFLWSKVFQQIHLALVELQDDKGQVPVGISFPEYNENTNFLGSKVRFFGATESILNSLDIKKWIQHFNDYVHCTQIRPVPTDKKQFSIFSRKQPGRSHSKLIRTIKRKADRDGISLEEAAKYISNEDDNISLKLPFINLVSLSSGKSFRLFIDKKSGLSDPVNGTYSSYGLCPTTTVPDF